MNLAGEAGATLPLSSRRGSYPEVGQLQGNLHKGVRAGSTLLDEAFAKRQELEAVQLHVVCQCLGHLVGALDDGPALPRYGRVSCGQSSPSSEAGQVSVSPQHLQTQRAT